MNFKKKLSQNFLINPIYLEKINNSIKPFLNSIYIEVGFGNAGLSKKILIKFIKYNILIYFIELEKYFFFKFRNFYNLNLKKCNILFFNFFVFKKFIYFNFKINIFGNIPYNITRLLFLYLIKSSGVINNIFILVQEDFYLKINKNKKISIILKLFYKIKKKFYLNNISFYPKPSVNSFFLKINSLYFLLIKKKDFFFFYKFINFLFFKKKNKNFIFIKKKINFKFNIFGINDYIFFFFEFKKFFFKY